VAAKVTDTLLMAREMFPGKANSLDALCKRLEVDNAHRTFHGALLDAGLLAEVYIRLTRGQDSLVIQAGDDNRPGQALAVPQLDLSGFSLPVIAPDADDIAAHEAVLKDLDKASGGKTVWRALAA
jgi:DNA polymerase-3 subunit epsilon